MEGVASVAKWLPLGSNKRTTKYDRWQAKQADRHRVEAGQLAKWSFSAGKIYNRSNTNQESDIERGMRKRVARSAAKSIASEDTFSPLENTAPARI